MLRLGKKYEIQHLKDHALAVLKREFPINLEDYDKVYADPDWTHFKSLLDDLGDARLRMERHAEIVELGAECGVQTIIPVAYLRLVSRALVSSSTSMTPCRCLGRLV